MSFSNPIVAGDTLIRDAIQSENFVTAVSGWRIEKTGAAEFNSLVARGEISVRNVAGDELAMDIFPGSLPAIRYTISGLTGFMQLEFAEYITVPTRVQGALFVQGQAGDLITLKLREDAAGFGEIVVNQEIVAEDPATGDSETWHALGGTRNSWTGGVYRLMPDGTVMFDEEVTSGTQTTGIQIATLPSGYRPRTATEFIVSRPGNYGTSKITIDTAGVMQYWANDGVWAGALSGMRYPLTVI